MNQTSRRTLTEGEIALAREAFGERIDYDLVGIRQGAGGNVFAWLAFLNRGVDAITLIRTIFVKSGPVSDFSKGGDAGLFLHEMTHIWQYQALGTIPFYWRYLLELVACRFRAPDLYRYERGRTAFPSARLEAQAQIVQDYHGVRGGEDGKAIGEIRQNLAGSGFYGL